MKKLLTILLFSLPLLLVVSCSDSASVEAKEINKSVQSISIESDTTDNGYAMPNSAYGTNEGQGIVKDSLQNIEQGQNLYRQNGNVIKQSDFLIEYQFLSWLQFSIIALIISFLFFIGSRFHLFNKHATEKSIGFRMFLYLLTVVLLVSFVLVKPFYHFLLLLVIFGFFLKNIVSYSRALFSLYFSKVKLGDKIRIGKEVGLLENMNFGGLHILTKENKVYFPFNMWNANKIVLESEQGTVLVSFECSDSLERNDFQSLTELKKSLFNYPFLSINSVFIEQEINGFKVTTRIAENKYKSGLESQVEKAGFRINRQN